MIEIITPKGERYSFDPSTERIFRDGYLIPSTEVEPIYSNSPNPNTPPIFSGILFVGEGRILSLSGKISQISDPNSII